MKSSGRFITFEGGEGAGKTTLIARLEEKLRSIERTPIVTREPGGTPLGEKIRHLVLINRDPICVRSELMLFLSSRAQHVDQLIKPALEEGKIVLCDRFNDSSHAYQGPHLDEKELMPLLNFAAFGLVPDLTFYLDLDPEIGFKRAQRDNRNLDRIESHDLTFHHNVRAAFLEIAKQNETRFRVIDASQSEDDVFDAVWHHLESKL